MLSLDILSDLPPEQAMRCLAIYEFCLPFKEALYEMLPELSILDCLKKQLSPETCRPILFFVGALLLSAKKTHAKAGRDFYLDFMAAAMVAQHPSIVEAVTDTLAAHHSALPEQTFALL